MFNYTEYIENLDENEKKLKENEKDVLKDLRFFNKNMSTSNFKKRETYFYYYNRDRI